MKRAISFAIAVVMIFAFACPAFAADNDFVGSITYKDGPAIVSVEIEGQRHDACVTISSIAQARAKSTDITQEERDLLLEVYEKLNDGTMDPGLGDDYVIRELVDINFKHAACRELSDHQPKIQELAKPEVTLTLVLRLGIAASDDIIVKAYKEGKWIDIETTNNGDGTVSCTFDHFCPVLFAVKGSGSSSVPPQTGDVAGQQLALWIGLMAVATAGLVSVIVVASRKKVH